MTNMKLDIPFREDIPEPPEVDEERTAKDWAIDIAVAVAAFVFGCAQLVLASTSVVFVDNLFREMMQQVDLVPGFYSYVALAFTTLPLVLRRVAPWPTLIIVTACFLFTAGYMYGFSLSAVGPVIAVFTVASERPRREAVLAVVVVSVAMALVSTPYQSSTLAFIMKGMNVVLVVAGGLAGFAMRVYSAYLVETRRRLDEAERGREELAARRVAEERVSIARDVHDITAHSLSAVAIQAAAAERLVDIDPAAAKEAIGDIRAVSKSALEEIRAMIGVLRGDEEAEKAPAEGTERMGDLVDYLERAGIRVTLSRRGYDRAAVPTFVDMTLFQVVREAATNTVRHAQAHAVTILLRSTASQAYAEFSDDGVGMDTDAAKRAEGHGLQGMAERVGAIGGTFTVRSAPGDGCTVVAEIPLEGNHG